MSRPLPYFVKIDDKATNLPGYIHGFFGEHRFLSNFHVHQPLTYYFDEIPLVAVSGEFASSEAYYQFAKIVMLFQLGDERITGKVFREEMNAFQVASPAESKKLAARYQMTTDQIEEWNSMRVAIMFRAIETKFAIPELQEKLLSTQDAHLEESLWWNDTFWGVQYDMVEDCGPNNKNPYFIAKDESKWHKREGKNMLGKILMNVREKFRLLQA